jgi:hypothetical protein
MEQNAEQMAQMTQTNRDSRGGMKYRARGKEVHGSGRCTWQGGARGKEVHVVRRGTWYFFWGWWAHGPPLWMCLSHILLKNSFLRYITTGRAHGPPLWMCLSRILLKNSFLRYITTGRKKVALRTRT